MYNIVTVLAKECLMLGFQLVPKVHIVGRLEDSQSCTGLVKGGDFDSRIQQFHVKIGQQQSEELFNLVHGKKSARAFSNTRAERHAEITQASSISIKGCFLLTVLIKETVKLVLLQD